MGLSFPGTGMQVDKLWENLNPGDSFGAQKIPLDLSGYDAILITLMYAASSSPDGSMTKTDLVPKMRKESVQVFNFGNFTAGSVRQITPKDDEVTISDGVLFDWGSDKYVTRNDAGIPISIYGVKF